MTLALGGGSEWLVGETRTGFERGWGQDEWAGLAGSGTKAPGAGLKKVLAHRGSEDDLGLLDPQEVRF